MSAPDQGKLASQAMESALALAARGFHAFPADHPTLPRCRGIKTRQHHPDKCTEQGTDRGKHPACKWSEWSTTDSGLLVAPHFFGGREPRNSGVDCGKSGVLVLDEDAEGELARACIELGIELPPTYTVQSADGTHSYFRRNGHELGNHEGAFRPYAINVRGVGGYVIGEGSLHRSGVVYTRVSETTELADIPGDLVKALTSKPARKRQAKAKPKDRTGDEESRDRTEDEFEGPDDHDARHEWWRHGDIAIGQRHASIVAAAGWYRAMAVPFDGIVPALRDLYARFDRSDGKYGSFDDDVVAMAEDVYGRYDEGDRTEARQRVADEDAWHASTPKPLDEARRTPLPALDGHASVAFVGLSGYVDSIAERYQVPRDLPWMLVLATLSAAVGGRRWVQVTPDWGEQLALYATVALPPGERKSPVLARVTAPLVAMERELRELTAPKALEANVLRGMYAANVAKLKKKGKVDPDSIREVLNAEQELADLDEVVIPRLLADDITPEALAALMAEQGGRIAVLSAEAGLFGTLAGRYSEGRPNLDLVLKAWSGDYCRVDRMSRPPLVLYRPVLSLGLAIQPDLVAGLADSPQFRGAGLLARILWALPASRVGTREIRDDLAPQSDPNEKMFVASVKDMVERIYLDDEPRAMLLAPGAREELRRLREDLEPRIHPERGDLAAIADWANKLPGSLVRIAALLELFLDPVADEVGEDAMATAAMLYDYLIDHAVTAFELMAGRRRSRYPAEQVLAWIRRKGPRTFTTRDAHRGVEGQAWAADVEHVCVALAWLAELGWIRRLPDKPTGGRPTERWEAHPAALEWDAGMHRQHDKRDRTPAAPADG